MHADNRGYRYGEALFETMKVSKGNIQLEVYHYERLFAGMQLLDFPAPPHFNREQITGKIKTLCEKNKCEELGRVRLSIFSGNGGLFEFDNTSEYLIEAWPIENKPDLNTNGLVIDIFPGAMKTVDRFSNLKSSNFLVYAQAARYAKKSGLNECLVLNTNKTIADACISNLFIIKNKEIFTIPLSDGPVAGVMRRHLISKIHAKERSVSVEDLLDADEVFLTNAISGIRWVKQFRDRVYGCDQIKEIYQRHVRTTNG